jgi:putative protein-disulfide isomerase
MKPVLYYIHDPMCSWCWAFRPVYAEIRHAIADQVNLIELLGGLAPDTEQPMPIDMQQYLQQTWRTIQQRVPSTRFNFDFWTKCKPLRSTYPACRAVIAARYQGEHNAGLMTYRIQTAYYTEARNPSELAVLVQLATEIGLDVAKFREAIAAEATRQQLLDEIAQSRRLNVDSFPSLLLDMDGSQWRVPVDYNDADVVLGMIRQILSSHEDGITL